MALLGGDVRIPNLLLERLLYVAHPGAIVVSKQLLKGLGQGFVSWPGAPNFCTLAMHFGSRCRPAPAAHLRQVPGIVVYSVRASVFYPISYAAEVRTAHIANTLSDSTPHTALTFSTTGLFKGPALSTFVPLSNLRDQEQVPTDNTAIKGNDHPQFAQPRGPKRQQ